MPATRQAAEEFENRTMIRHNHRFLIAMVYLDMEPTRWAVAFAYNPARYAGPGGHENALEVRYTYVLHKRMTMEMMRSDPFETAIIPAGPFPDPDTFARYAITYERNLNLGK